METAEGKRKRKRVYRPVAVLRLTEDSTPEAGGLPLSAEQEPPATSGMPSRN